MTRLVSLFGGTAIPHPEWSKECRVGISKEQRTGITAIGKPQSQIVTLGGAIRPLIPQIMEYRNLQVNEKIEQVRQYRPSRDERQYMAIYLKALRRGDRKVTEEYESFGNSPRQIIMNRTAYDRGQLFGFTEKYFSKYGWLQNSPFTEREEIRFIHKPGWAGTNHLTIGQGENGKWTYGVSFSTGSWGHCYGLSIWGKVFEIGRA